MRALRELLDTWENWSARETLTRALSRIRTDDARDNLTRALAEAPEVDPLDALRDTAELVALLTGWQWQAVYAARADGADWGQIADAIGTTVERARYDYIAAVERQERCGIASADAYREVL